jgi:glutamate-1-semialdehyde 2,1-aminomutase
VAPARLVTSAADLVRAYLDSTPASAATFEAARRVLPGGETRAVTTYPPYPVIITEGQGGWLLDVDGHRYLDLVNNYTSLVHGNAFAPVTDELAELLPRGLAFASPHPHQIALAELLIGRLPSVQRMRFTNSGTEASLLAARIVARATGRRRLLLFDGAYHGSTALFLPGSPDVIRAPSPRCSRSQVTRSPRCSRSRSSARAGSARPHPGSWPGSLTWRGSTTCSSSSTRCRRCATG